MDVYTFMYYIYVYLYLYLYIVSVCLVQTFFTTIASGKIYM